MRNKVLDCIYTRRSVRKYLDKPVPKELIDELLNAAVMAPSAMNSQPWHFTIVEGKEKIAYFGERVFKRLKSLDIEKGYKPAKPEHIFYRAPLLILISGKRDYKWLKDDINLAVQNMFLTAHSLGFGSCWIGFAKSLDSDEDARKELGIPEDFEIVAPLIFGYPKYIVKQIPKRKPKILKYIK